MKKFLTTKEALSHKVTAFSLLFYISFAEILQKYSDALDKLTEENNLLTEVIIENKLSVKVEEKRKTRQFKNALNKKQS